ncbi:glycosyltransferase [Sphingobacterium multivorum]|uniref:glycosyltransferase n=1 Tax=Sphingobacterium multivorum TaxID=28454 RepID=UPI003DA44459
MDNIVFIITDYGSFNNFLGELAIALIGEGKKVNVICSRDKVIDIEDKYDYISAGVNFYNVSFPRNFNLILHYRVSAQIHRILDSIDSDLISVHFTTAIFTTLLKAKRKEKIVGTYHGVGYPMIDSFFKKNVFKIVELFTMKRLDEVWVLNRFDEELLISKFPNKIKLLPTKGLGCNLDVFDRRLFLNDIKDSLRATLQIRDQDFVILYTGRFVDFKGFDIVVKTLKYINQVYPNLCVKLITLGGRDKIHSTGLSEEEEYYFNNSGNIVNIGFTKDVAKYMSIADLFFFPSKKEGVPVCIIEALSMEVPVITYNARGCNDLIADNYNGRLLELVDNYEEFGKLIVSLIENRDILESYRRNIYKDRELYSRLNFIKFQIQYFNKHGVANIRG